jgi:alkaline phosphatase
MGGGRRAFLPVTVRDPETNKTGVNKRLDGHNLIDTWKTLQQGKNKKHAYVWRKKEFDAVNENDVDFLLGKSRNSVHDSVILKLYPNYQLSSST